MITRLEGTTRPLFKDKSKYIIEVHLTSGIGYEVQVPLNYDRSFMGGYDNLHVHHSFTDQGQFLFGFIFQEERAMFRKLLSCKDVGLQKAMALVSKFTIEQIIEAIRTKDATILAKANGIGIKLATNIIEGLNGSFQ